MEEPFPQTKLMSSITLNDPKSNRHEAMKTHKKIHDWLLKIKLICMQILWTAGNVVIAVVWKNPGHDSKGGCVTYWLKVV